MSKRTRVRLLLVGEFEVNGPDPLPSALAQPATEYGVTLYQATVADVAGFAGALWVENAANEGDGR